MYIYYIYMYVCVIWLSSYPHLFRQHLASSLRQRWSQASRSPRLARALERFIWSATIIGWFLKSWAYAQIMEVMDDHDLVLTLIETHGDLRIIYVKKPAIIVWYATLMNRNQQQHATTISHHSAIPSTFPMWSCLCQKASKKAQPKPNPWGAPQHEPNIRADLCQFGFWWLKGGGGWAWLGSLPKKCWSSIVKWQMESTAFHHLMSIMPAHWEPHICPALRKNKNSSIGTEYEKSPRAD